MAKPSRIDGWVDALLIAVVDQAHQDKADPSDCEATEPDETGTHMPLRDPRWERPHKVWECAEDFLARLQVMVELDDRGREKEDPFGALLQLIT